MQKVIANVSLQQIQRNAKRFINRTHVPLCAVVKANGYGHGAVEIVNCLQNVASSFAVSLIEEGIEIMPFTGGKDVLVLTPPVDEKDVLLGARHRFVLTVSDENIAKMMDRISREYALPIRVHIKGNTGMNRYGVNVQTLGKICKRFRNHPYIQVEGLYSHLYGNDKQTAEKQLVRFQAMQRVAKGYFPTLICHLSATYGALLDARFFMDMVRIGIGLYGYYPNASCERIGIRPAMQVFAPVTATRKYVFGGAGYGEDLPSDMQGERLATLRVGYGDGVLRKQGKEGDDNLRPVCMDAVVRRGKYKKGRLVPIMLNAEQTALAQDTISYEVLCAITKRAYMLYDYS